MTFGAPGQFPRRTNSKPLNRSPLFIAFIAFVVISIFLVSLSGFYADWLWYKSIGYTSVWLTTLGTKVGLFLIFGAATSLIAVSNIWIAYKRRPIYAPLSVEEDNLERYRSQLEPIRRWVFIALVFVFFYFGGSTGSSLWRQWLEFINSTSFGTKDPQFNLDISFFAFKLPIYQALISWAASTLILSLIHI